MVLVGLDEVEVAALTLRETILAVELDLGNRRGVGESGIRVAPRRVELRVAVQVAGVLDNPDKLLARVVERELDLVRRGGNRLRARELELLNEVLVGDLCEAAALLCVEVDVINVERAGGKALVGNRAEDLLHGVEGRRGLSCKRDVAEVLEVLELDVDLYLVVLEGNQREREARVAVEPELQRNVQRLLRDAVRQAALAIRNLDNGAGAECAVIAEVGKRGVEACKCGRILRVKARDAGVAARISGRKHRTTIAIHHVEVGELLARGERELVPDVEPLTIVLVDLLAADLNIDVVDQVLAEVGDPRKAVARANDTLVNRRERDLDIDTRDQIAVAADRALDTLAKVADAVEGLLDRLHREVGVTTVQLLPKGNLRVTRKIYVLSAICDKLHQTTRHCLYFTDLKLFWPTRAPDPNTGDSRLSRFSWSRLAHPCPP